MIATSLPTSGFEHVPPAASRPAKWSLTRRTRAALGLTLAFWGSNYVLLTLGTALSGNDRLEAIAGMRILTTFLGLAFCYGIHLLLSHPRIHTPKRRLITLALVAPIAAETFAWATYFAESAADPSISLQTFSWPAAVRTVAFWTWFFLAWAGVYLALMYSFDVQEEQRRAVQLKEEAHVAQLRALHSQINPHFLFNSLNSVSALILDGRSERAEEMVLKLASFLRLGLAADPTRKIPLELELRLQQAYLDIERLRYPDLEVLFTVPQVLEGMLVPSLILQPIIENAIKYGVAGAPPPTTIEISARSKNWQLVIEITDSGRGTAVPSGAGIGLANVRQRLDLMYPGTGSSLTTKKEVSGQFRVRIAIPLEPA